MYVTYTDYRVVEGRFRGRDRNGDFTNRFALAYRVARPEARPEGPFFADLDFGGGPEEEAYLSPDERKGIEGRAHASREVCRASTEEALQGLISRYAGRHGLNSIAFRTIDGGSA